MHFTWRRLMMTLNCRKIITKNTFMTSIVFRISLHLIFILSFIEMGISVCWMSCLCSNFKIIFLKYLTNKKKSSVESPYPPHDQFRYNFCCFRLIELTNLCAYSDESFHFLSFTLFGYFCCSDVLWLFVWVHMNKRGEIVTIIWF